MINIKCLKCNSEIEFFQICKSEVYSECFSKRLQIQEHLTDQIVDAIMTYLDPQGAGVIIKAKHLCMSHRGVKNSTSEIDIHAIVDSLDDEKVSYK